ncbi:MAG: hypothetical protein LBI13_01325 [Streptococcaceae bacterium]|jgi:hypothetical protein|nr:hypothetical protein [Streptococcaceae bacterium]
MMMNEKLMALDFTELKDEELAMVNGGRLSTSQYSQLVALQISTSVSNNVTLLSYELSQSYFYY